jgi:hypothetical protein
VPTSRDDEVVRPTRKSLDDLSIGVPELDVPLHTIDNDHLKEVQKVPLYAQSGGAEPIRKITDRVVFKYKSSNVRGAVTKLKESEVAVAVRESPQIGRWWAVAFGYRQADSGQRDFYARLPGSSDGLIPTEWDQRRLEAELANQWVERVRQIVRRLIRTCLLTGNDAIGEAAGHYVRARVTNGDEVYLTLGAGGIYNTRVIAVILDSVPGLSLEDWFIEPSVELAVEPDSGEVVWSALLPEESRALLLDDGPP